MRYLAISKATTFFAYALFEDDVLIEVDVKLLYEYDSVLRIKEIYKNVIKLIDTFRPSVVVTHALEVQKIMKKDLERIIGMKTAIKLATIETKTLYLEAKTSGWEKYILGGNVTDRKVMEVYERYYGFSFDTFLKSDGRNYTREVADAIILGEAVAHKRIHV